MDTPPVNKAHGVANVYRVPYSVDALRPLGANRCEGGDLMATAEFLNVRETADRLGVHENTIRNWEKSGHLRAAKLPGSGFRRFRIEDVEQMRGEMLEQFAPDTPMPEQRRPKSRTHLTGEDY